MIKLEINEIVYIHNIISQQNIKGADAPFIANILGKLSNEAALLQNNIKKIDKRKK
jgi:hypothetical protein